MHEGLLKLTEPEFINLFGFFPDQIPAKIVISPTISFKTIKNLITIKKQFLNHTWFKSILFSLNNQEIWVIKSLPGYTNPIDIINFLLPQLKRESTFIFYGAAGLLNNDLKINQLYPVSHTAYLDQNNTLYQNTRENLLHASGISTSLISTPFITFETDDNLLQWKNQKYDLIDLEAGFFNFWLRKLKINHQILIYGTDFPLTQKIFSMNLKKITQLGQEPAIQFIDFLNNNS